MTTFLKWDAVCLLITVTPLHTPKSEFHFAKTLQKRTFVSVSPIMQTTVSGLGPAAVPKNPPRRQPIEIITMPRNGIDNRLTYLTPTNTINVMSVRKVMPQIR